MKNYTVSIKPNFDTVKQSSVYPVGSDFAANQNYANGLKLSPATKDNLGGVIVGNNLVVTEDGTLSAIGEGVAGVSSFNSRTQDVTLTSKDVVDALGFSPTPYKLIPATDKVLGGVKVGGNLEVTPDGTLSADIGVESFDGRKGAITLLDKDIEKAIGFVPEKIAPATALKLGGIKVGKNLTVEADGTLNAVGGSTAGVDSFNGRKGDVKLTEKDITDLVPKYDLPVSTDKILGGVIVGDNLTIDSKGRLSAKDVASGVETFNGRGGKVELTAKDVTDVVEIPKPYALPIASKTALGGFKVGKNLTISADGVLDAEGGGGVVGVASFNGRKGEVTLTSEDVEAVVEIASKSNLGVIKVGKNLTIDPDGTLNAEGGSGDAGVSSFNGRKGDVKFEAKDVPIDNASIVINEKGELKAVGGGEPYTLPIASETSLGGIKVGDNLTIDKNGRLSAKSGGGQGAPHRFIYAPDETVAPWTNYYLSKNDINGYVVVATGFNPIALVLPADVYHEAGDTIEIINATGEVAFFSASSNNYIYLSQYTNNVKESGSVKLLYLGVAGDFNEESRASLKGLMDSDDPIDDDQHIWFAIGDLDAADYELKKPAISAAVVGDHQVTLTLDLPDELIPVMGYDFDAVCKGDWKHYSFPNDGRKEVVLDGLDNMTEYKITYHTFATCGVSPDSDPINVTPQEKKPSAPTVLSVGSHWDGAKFNFAEPTDKAARITGWVVKDQDGKVYDLTDIQGEDLFHSGWFKTQIGKTWQLALAGKNETGIGDYSAVHTVETGASVVTPKTPKFDAEANIDKVVGWTAPTSWGMEDGYTAFEIVAHDVTGTDADDVVVQFPKDTKSGVTGKLQCSKTYKLFARGIYPNGKTSPSKPVDFYMWECYVKEPPKSVTIDATAKDAIYVTVNDACKLPCTGFEVWIDGHPIAKQVNGSARLKVDKGYTGGVECLIQVRWIEVDNQFSDLDAGKRVVPSAPAPNVPELGRGTQNVGLINFFYSKNTSGAAATNYYLMTRLKGDQNWRKTDVTNDVLTTGKVSFQPLISTTTKEVQYCGSAKNASGESMFSDPQSLLAFPYMPSDAPNGGVHFSQVGDSLSLMIDPSRFAELDQHQHFTGIIMKYSINDGAAQTVVKPVDWKGSTGDWYGANKGDTLSISFAAQTWGSVTGYFTNPVKFSRI